MVCILDLPLASRTFNRAAARVYCLRAVEHVAAALLFTGRIRLLDFFINNTRTRYIL